MVSALEQQREVPGDTTSSSHSLIGDNLNEVPAENGSRQAIWRQPRSASLVAFERDEVTERFVQLTSELFRFFTATAVQTVNSENG